MSTERAEGYIEALSNVKSTIERRLSEGTAQEDGRHELSNLLIMVDDMLRHNRPVPEAESAAPEPLSGSF